MALVSPADRRYVITTADNGNYKALGNTSEREVGVWSVSFTPSSDWDGSFTIMGRHMGKPAGDDAQGYGTVAYIRVQLNGAAADYELVPDVLYGDAVILVPASGLSIAVAVTCVAGTCTMYSHPLHGTPGPWFRVGL